MDVLPLREPFSALSHAAGFALAVPGTWLLCRLGRDPTRRRSALVFGLCLAGCYAASAHYHAADGPAERIAFYRRLDHIGIYLLIAGTYTPLAGILLAERWRNVTLAAAWLAAGVGSAVLLVHGVLPTWLSTSIYMLIGWAAYFVYREIGRRHPGCDTRPILVGGLLYSLGALINLTGWPDPLPGHVGAHGLFHLFVLAGSLAHYAFILSIVALGDPVEQAARWSLRFQGPHTLLRRRRKGQPAEQADRTAG